MIYLTYDNKIFEFDEDILKISTYLTWLNEGRSSNDEPLILQHTTDKIFGIFKEWFNELKAKGIVRFKFNSTVIFKPEMLKRSVHTLLELFNFALYNQIRLLCETVAFVLGLRCEVLLKDSKFYVKHHQNTYPIHETLALMILKNMSDEKFSTHSKDVRNSLNQRRKPIVPYSETLDNFDDSKVYLVPYFTECIEDLYDIPTSVCKIEIPYHISKIDTHFISKFSRLTLIFNNTLYKVSSTETSFTIPDYVKHIDSFAFLKCSELKTVTIPSSLTSFNRNIFENCRKLKLIHEKTLIKVPRTTTSFDVPESIEIISQSAFFNCRGLTHVSLPNVSVIESKAFELCVALSNITLPSTLKVLGTEAFECCDNLISVSLPNSLTKLEPSVFNQCDSLSSITLSTNLTSIPSRTFRQCTSLKSVKLPESIRVIGENAFEECCALESISIPKSVVKIDSSCFSKCSNLTSINLPSQLSTVAENTFKGCKKLKKIVIPRNVNILHIECFNGCSSLERVEFEEGSCLERINIGTFGNCESLKEIKLPTSVHNIGGRVFANCKNLKHVELSDVKDIKYFTFQNCKKLKSINIPSTVSAIHGSAFKNCVSLSSIEIPNSTTFVEKHAFENCNFTPEVVKKLSEKYSSEIFETMSSEE